MNKLLITAATISVLLTSNMAMAGRDKVIAKYNGQKVYKSEIEDAYSNLIMKTTGKQIDEKSNFDNLKKTERDRLVRGIISNKLLEENVKKSKIQSTKEYKKAMKDAAEQIAKRVFLEKMFDEKISEKMIKQRYKSLAEKLSKKDEVKASHILVKDEAKAKDIYAKLKKGQSFEKLAEENSIDGTKKNKGDLGYFTKGQMVKEFEQAAFSLEKGQFSKPVKTNFGWHIIKLNDKRKMKAPAYAEIKTRLKAEMSGEILQEYMKSLEDSATIKLMLD